MVMFLSLVVNVAAKIVVAGAFGVALDAIARHNSPLLWRELWLFTVAAIAQPLSTATATYARGILGMVVGNQLREDFHRRLLDAPLGIHDRQHPGDLQTRLSGDVAVIRGAVGSLSTLVQQPLLLVGSVVYLWHFSPTLALIVVPLGPASYVVTRVWQPSLYRWSRQVRETESSLAQQAIDTMHGIASVQAYRIEPILHARYVKNLRAWYEVSREMLITQQSLSLTAGQLGMFAFIAVLLVGGRATFAGHMAIGTLVIASQLMNFVVSPYGLISNAWGQLQSARASWERIHDWQQEWAPEPHQSGAAVSAITIPSLKEAPEIRLEAVSFAYPEQPPLLNRVTCTLPARKLTALVGPNGCGKSTVAKLLLELYRPSSGHLWWNGRKFDELSTDEIRRHTVYLAQEPFLVAGTVQENLSLVTEAVHDDRVQSALMQVGLPTTPDFLNRRVGEQGKALSGGERLRLAMARALLRDASLWVLDEPTASLDPATAVEFREMFRQFGAGRTVLVITHDEELAMRADQVLTLTRSEGFRVMSG